MTKTAAREASGRYGDGCPRRRSGSILYPYEKRTVEVCALGFPRDFYDGSAFSRIPAQYEERFVRSDRLSRGRVVVRGGAEHSRGRAAPAAFGT